MNKRNNVLENFESCYLRENCARKAFANTEAVKRLMGTGDFERCVRYIANITFNKNKNTLLRHGFDHDDIVNVSRVFAMQFVNNEFEGDTKKDTYYILMRFISQKFETFMLFLNRKFRISERHAEVSLEDTIEMDIYNGAQPVDVIEDEDEPERSKTVKKLDLIAREIGEFKTDIMRARLKSDINSYASRLSEIATSKSVEFAVRKKARRVCKENGIDYLAWARAQIKARKLSESDFVL